MQRKEQNEFKHEYINKATK